MPALNPKKLLNSKWTAIKPEHGEKHFIITRVGFTKTGQVDHCQMQAVLTGRQFLIDWQQLKQTELWQAGWQ